MPRLLLAAALLATPLMLSACSASQSDIDAAAVYHCQLESLLEQRDIEGETEELRSEIARATVYMEAAIEESSAPEEVWDALDDVECP